MSIRTFISLSFAVTSLAAAGPDFGLTSPAFGAHPRLEPIALDYEVSWQGVFNSGDFHMEFAPPGEKKPGAYVVKAHASSQGAAAKLHPYQYNSWSELNPASLAPRYVRAAEQDRNGKEVSIVEYLPGRVEVETTYKSSHTGKTGMNHRTTPHSPVFDIFSAMLHIRSQPLVQGERIAIMIQSGDQPYVIRVRCLGREVHNGRNAIKLSAGMQKIDHKTGELQVYKKLKRDATLWLSDDYDRIPLEVRGEIFLGDVRVTLTQQKKL